MGAWIIIIRNFLLGVTGKKGVVHFLQSGNEELGYSFIEKGLAHIYVNPEHTYFKGMRAAKRYIYTLALSTHEISHILLTDFVEWGERIRKSKFPDFFKNVANIVEDGYINSQSEYNFGPICCKAVNALTFLTWDATPEIQKWDAPIAAVMSALLMFEFQGIIKGEENLTVQEKNVMAQILPLYAQAMTEPCCAKRFDISEQITDIIVSEFGQTAANAYARRMPQAVVLGTGRGQNGKTGKLSKKQLETLKKALEDGNVSFEPGNGDENNSAEEQNKGNSNSSGDELDVQMPDMPGTAGSGKGGSSDGDKNSEKPDENSAEAGKTADAEGDEDVTSSGTESKDGKTGKKKASKASKTDKNSDEPSKEDLKELSEEITSLLQQAQQKLNKQKSNGWVKAEEVHDSEVDSLVLNSIATTEEDINEYLASFISGEALKCELEPVLKAKRTGFVASDRGTINVKRYKIPQPLTANVFDKRLKKVNDVSILLLVDQSGSMSGSRIANVKKMAMEMAEAFNSLEIPFAVCGYHSRGGYSSQFNIFKDFESDNWQNIANMYATGMNYDGVSIRRATRMLEEQPTQKKLLIVLTDGESHDEYNCRKAVEEAQEVATTVGISLCVGEYAEENFRKMYGENYIPCDDPKILHTLLSRKLEQLCESW